MHACMLVLAIYSYRCFCIHGHCQGIFDVSTKTIAIHNYADDQKTYRLLIRSMYGAYMHACMAQ